MKPVLFDIALKRLFQNMTFHNTEKAETCHGNLPQVLFVARTAMAKELTEAGFVFLFLKLGVNRFTCRLMCVNTTKCTHFHLRKGIFDWKQALERLRSHEHSMEHKDATITFSRRCN